MHTFESYCKVFRLVDRLWPGSELRKEIPVLPLFLEESLRFYFRSHHSLNFSANRCLLLIKISICFTKSFLHVRAYYGNSAKNIYHFKKEHLNDHLNDFKAATKFYRHASYNLNNLHIQRFKIENNAIYLISIFFCFKRHIFSKNFIWFLY